MNLLVTFMPVNSNIYCVSPYLHDMLIYVMVYLIEAVHTNKAEKGGAYHETGKKEASYRD